ncbi:hypothetical protein [Alkalicoccobacillus murimartini]|uniref:DUF1129 family protein n=1 Tax=Alkalicoccobacillus murimartini TaxID=171685 RepID=A0ABT9YD89_9BACI|nr:hypothetical protein [Alkalicoccobacillus murimartini]MDQ0205691.1 hypothetical protein [Alkalicoccobacillus murimartini]
MKFNVDYPNEEEVKNHITQIVNAGMPEKENFIDRLFRMYRHVGFGHLFKDKTEIIFLAIIGFLVMCFLSLSLTHKQFSDSVYIFIFTISPCIYFILALRSFVHKFNKKAEIEHTTKYSFTQMSAFRMLVFSIFSFLLNTTFIALISLFITEISILRAFLVMSCSLLFFSVLFLFIFKHSTKSWVQSYGLGLVWIFGNIVLYYINPNGFKVILLQIPLFGYMVISLIGFILLFRAIQSLFFYNIHKEVG